MPENVRLHTISADEAGQRLDNFLIRVLKKVPKPLIYKIIRRGEVRVNKGRVKPDRKLLQDDIVRIPPVRVGPVATASPPSDGLRQRLAAAILYEDEGLLIVDKPAGLAVHGGSGIRLGLVESLREIHQDTYLELAHRLDRETSGCLMIAKKRSVLRQLHALLRTEHGIQKRYLALVKGRWPSRRGSVNAALKKNDLIGGERVVRVDRDGKASRTLFSIEKRFNEATLLCVTPLTGRTHQIRVHTQHAGYPLVGDEKYGDAEFNKAMKPLGFRRLFLHAASLCFTLDGHKTVKVEAPLPDDLARAIGRLSPEISGKPVSRA